MTTKQHIVYYKSYAIYYMNGTYSVPQIPKLSFLNINEAKQEIDKIADVIADDIMRELINQNKTSDKKTIL